LWARKHEILSIEDVMRTNIEVDDELLRHAMRSIGACNKEAVVEAGLRLLVEIHDQTGIRRLRGNVHWRGDLKSLRRGRLRD
jgi:Arc/MetJ family transcription regulator